MAPQVMCEEKQTLKRRGDNERERQEKTNQDREEKCVKRAIEERIREDYC